MTDQTLLNASNTGNPGDKSPDFEDIIKPEDLAREKPDLFTEGKIKWLIRQREHNGLSDAGAVVKCGRSLFLVKTRFFNWLLSNRA